MKHLPIIILACAAFAAQALHAQELQWERVQGIDSVGYVRALASNGRFVFAAVDKTGLLRSGDFGNSWSVVEIKKNNSQIVRSLLFTEDTLIAGVAFGQPDTSGIFRSTDAGASWKRVYTYNEATSLGKIGNILFAGFRYNNSIRSTNNGRSWGGGGSLKNPYLYCAADSFVFAGIYSGLKRSNDSSSSWNTIAFGGRTMRGICYDGGYLLISHDLVPCLRSTDYGLTWTFCGRGLTLENQIDYLEVYYMYAANGKVYAGGNGGVHSTDDHGITPWKYAGNGLPKGEIVRLLHAQGEYLFAAVGSKGLYRAKLPAVGVEEPPTPSMLTISPNPTADGFTVRYTDKGGRTLAVRDMFGRIRFQAEIKFSQGNSEISVPTDDFAQGVYYVEIINADGSRASAKVIFNR